MQAKLQSKQLSVKIVKKSGSCVDSMTADCRRLKLGNIKFVYAYKKMKLNVEIAFHDAKYGANACVCMYMCVF